MYFFLKFGLLIRCSAALPAPGKGIRMKKLIFGFALFLTALLSNSQNPLILRSALSTGGSSISVSHDGSLTTALQCIGQNGVTGVFSNKNLELRQGFIQPVMIIESFLKKENNKISIYPNPFSSVIFVKLDEGISGDLDLKISDLAGRQVYSVKMPAAETSQINPGSLHEGIYILTVRNKRIQAIYKIIKN